MLNYRNQSKYTEITSVIFKDFEEFSIANQLQINWIKMFQAYTLLNLHF